MTKADTRADPILEDAIERGYVGTDEPYTISAPLPSHGIANDARKLVQAAAKRRNLAAGAWVTDHDGQQCLDGWRGAPPCQDPEGPHYVKFRLWSKDAARTHVFRQTGGDPSKLKYNPWRQGKTQKYDDHGNPA